MKLNPNCSEAILRINLTNLTKQEKELLDDRIKKAEEEEGWWGETSYSYDRVFGIDTVKIDGNAPYNSHDELIRHLNKLPFWGKVDYEDC